MEQWTKMIDDGLPIEIIYTDFAKAFDRVPHQRLLQKIKNMGIIGMTQAWISAILTGRTQRVRVERGVFLMGTEWYSSRIGSRAYFIRNVHE